jgi:hypothetical protein
MIQGKDPAMDGHGEAVDMPVPEGGDATATVLGLTAAVLQTLLLLFILVLGLTWGGWSHLLSLALTLLGLVVVIGMTVRRRRSVVAVPVASGALALLLSFLGPLPVGSA